MKIELVFNEEALSRIEETDKTIEEAKKYYCGHYFNLGEKNNPYIDKVIIMYVYDDNGNIIKRYNEWGKEFEKTWFGK